VNCADTQLLGCFCGRAVLLSFSPYYFHRWERDTRDSLQGEKKQPCTWNSLPSSSSGHLSTYTGLAGLSAPSAASGTKRRERRPLTAIRKMKYRLLGQMKNPFSNKNITQWYCLLSDNTSSPLPLLQWVFFLTAIFVIASLDFLEWF